MTDDEVARISHALRSKGVNKPCLQCDSPDVRIQGYLSDAMREDTKGLGGIKVTPPTTPSVLLICENCGAMYQHALGMLGLMPG
jgi:hypothetical protein